MSVTLKNRVTKTEIFTMGGLLPYSTSRTPDFPGVRIHISNKSQVLVEVIHFENHLPASPEIIQIKE